MTLVRLQPGAAADAEEAAQWYEAQRPGLGFEFVLELDAAIERAPERPDSYQLLDSGMRRALMRRFPYAVYFMVENRCLEVFAILHQHRATVRWQSRLR